jgi:hypothetical protein
MGWLKYASVLCSVSSIMMIAPEILFYQHCTNGSNCAEVIHLSTCHDVMREMMVMGENFTLSH